MLRPNDRCLEVTVSRRDGPSFLAGTSDGTSSEKLTSKTAIPMYRWTHVALVAEASQLRMYVNGVLDAQRTNYTHSFPSSSSSSSQSPLYVGKLPKEVRTTSMMVDPSSSKDMQRMPASGFDGSMARLRFHARALSPIHVRVDCEKGPPRATIVRDGRCFRLLLLLLLTTRSETCVRMLTKRRWLVVLFEICKYGTNRVSQSVFRILRKVLAVISPKEVSQKLKLGNSKHSFVTWMLREIGAASMVEGGEGEESEEHSTSTLLSFRVNFLKLHEMQLRAPKGISGKGTGKINNTSRKNRKDPKNTNSVGSSSLNNDTDGIEKKAASVSISIPLNSNINGNNGNNGNNGTNSGHNGSSLVSKSSKFVLIAQNQFHELVVIQITKIKS